MNDLHTARWRKVRAAFLEQEPNCRACGRRGTVVDHIMPRRLGGDSWDTANLQTLCSAHHAAKTGKEKTIYRVLKQRLAR